MTEAGKTSVFAGVAVALAVVAWLTAPRGTTPEVFLDRGSTFFPAFTDPTAARALEIVEFDEETAIARPFRVQVRNGLWTIPSYFDYPADDEDRLSKIAAAMIALKKEDVATENVSDHERTGTLDPLDETLPNLKGRGTRVTITNENGQPLADIVIGRALEGRPTFRYVRVPQQKRVYVAELGDLNVSTRLADWIDRDLLHIEWDDVDQVVIRDYSLDQATGSISLHDTLFIQKVDPDGWALRGGDSAGDRVDTFTMNLLVTTLDQLAPLAVRPKPAGIAAGLSQTGGRLKVSQNDLQEFANRGFHFIPSGQLVADEGEVLVHTRDGVFYSLRFGAAAPGEAVALATTASTGSGVNRYLSMTASFDPGGASAGPARSAAEKRAALLRARYAPWLYVISAESFRRIHLQRRDLIKR